MIVADFSKTLTWTELKASHQPAFPVYLGRHPRDHSLPTGPLQLWPRGADFLKAESSSDIKKQDTAQVQIPADTVGCWPNSGT